MHWIFGAHNLWIDHLRLLEYNHRDLLMVHWSCWVQYILYVEYRIDPSLYIDRSIGGTLRRAFIIENMPRISRLQPATKNEIEAITWFNLNDLPTHVHDKTPIEKLNTRPNCFFLVVPFIR
ncbi:unnamed protein product [Echinostoma caproni]|uniref:Nudix hydrolase domain-containing protein n=1 Tax=Echinostoma caproni TaxID=27848 RepID=A0A183BGF4_9TREM|nr:unnamed protein product [Echinostoma caproni]